MRKFFLICIISLSTLCANAQKENIPVYDVPKEYSLVLPEDYTKYEPQLMQTIDWYLWRSISLDAEKRQDAIVFFIKWITGSPTVTVDIHPEIISLIKNTPELLIAFMMGWVKYSINNNYSKDKIKCCNAGLQAVLDYYKKNRSYFSKHEDLEKYGKMNKNQQEKYIAKIFSSVE